MINMDPEQLGELLSAYLDDELGVNDTQIVETWLREDPEVRKQYEQMRQTVESVRSLPRHRPPEGLAQDLLAQLERHDLLNDADTPAPAKSVRAFPWLSTMAAAAVIGIVTFVGFRQFSTNDLPSSSDPVRLADADTSALNELGGAPELEDTMRESPGAARADQTPLIEKLASGITSDELRQHPFAAESVRLTVGLTESEETDSAIKRIVAHLTRTRTLDVSRVRGARLDANSDAFFLPGVRGTNFDDDGSQQLLVHVPSTVLPSLLDEIEQASAGADRVTLKAGSLEFEGLASARDTLVRQHGATVAPSEEATRSERFARRRNRRVNHLANRSVASDESKSKQQGDGDDSFSELLQTLGVPTSALDASNKAASPQLAAGESTELSGSPTSEPTTSAPEVRKGMARRSRVLANKPMTVAEDAEGATSPSAASAIQAPAAESPVRYVTLVLEFRSAPAPRSTAPDSKDSQRGTDEERRTTRPTRSPSK